MAKQIWLALRLPYFALEALDIDITEQAVLLITAKNKVCAASPICFDEGVRLDMPVSTARMLLNCEVLSRDKQKEQQKIHTICTALYAYTPYIEHYIENTYIETSMQGVLLELSRCVHLFGSIECLRDRIIDCMNTLGFTYVYALAFSAKAAWLLSYSQKPIGHCDNNLDDLLSLSTLLLVEHNEEAEALQQSGFETLHDIWQQLQKEGNFSLKKRCSPAFIDYLLDIFNPFLAEKKSQEDLFATPLFRASAPVYTPEEHYSDTRFFDYPIASIELLYAPMKQLLQNLCDYLVSCQKQCAGVQWVFSDIYHHSEYLNVRCERIYRDWSLLFELTHIQLDKTGLPFEVDQLELRRPNVLNLNIEGSELAIYDSKHIPDNNREEQLVIAKIQARIGPKNVFKLSYRDDHMPELSHRKIPAQEKPITALDGQHCFSPRPDWLFKVPMAIGTQQNNLHWHGHIQLVRGPERLQGHWWHKATERDYFIAVRDDQIRLWVFYDLLKKEWFVQGVF